MRERSCAPLSQPHPVGAGRPVSPGAARRVGARAFAVAVALAGCSTVAESVAPPISLTEVAPPSTTPAFDSDVTPSPPIVWVPEWGIYLHEGRDVVLHDGLYYRYEEGHWYAARSSRGPWTRLESRREGSSAGRQRVAPSHEPPPSTDGRQATRRSQPETGHAVVIESALQYVGVPYRWGGTTPAGFDCSGFVRYVYARAGLVLPRTAAAQYRIGTPVRRASLRPGDLVFFDRVRHNGIYIGHGKFVHASSGAGRVSVSRLDEDWFRRRWSGARRIQAVAPTDGHATRAGAVDAHRNAAESD